jgi:hypothetical protein
MIVDETPERGISVDHVTGDGDDARSLAASFAKGDYITPDKYKAKPDDV